MAREHRPQMLRDLAAAAQMPAAKAHRYLVSFMRMGLVDQQSETGLYDLGSFALELGLSAIARLEPVTLAAPVLAELSEEIGQTVALAVWANHGPTIVRWLGPNAPVSASMRVGSVMPLTRSATGQIFLSYLSTQTTAPLVKQELAQAQHGVTPRTRKEVDDIIASTRLRGFSRTSEFIPGIAGIAAPVFDHSGSLAMAIIALGYSKPFEASMDTIVSATMRKAQQLSKRLGATDVPTM
jgi:DNA-binding IclR family transcriptional regulator